MGNQQAVDNVKQCRWTDANDGGAAQKASESESGVKDGVQSSGGGGSGGGGAGGDETKSETKNRDHGWCVSGASASVHGCRRDMEDALCVWRHEPAVSVGSSSSGDGGDGVAPDKGSSATATTTTTHILVADGHNGSAVAAHLVRMVPALVYGPQSTESLKAACVGVDSALSGTHAANHAGATATIVTISRDVCDPVPPIDSSGVVRIDEAGSDADGENKEEDAKVRDIKSLSDDEDEDDDDEEKRSKSTVRKRRGARARRTKGRAGGKRRRKASVGAAEDDTKSVVDMATRVANQTREQLHLYRSTTAAAAGDGHTKAVGLGYRVSIAWLGDSPCIVVTPDGELLYATDDHHPGDDHEVARIRAAKGQLSYESGVRVEGLNLSRSFGDHETRRGAATLNLPPQLQSVSCAPDVAHLSVPPGSLIVVSCDGVYEKLSVLELTACLRPLVAERRAPEVVARFIVQLALASGSQDNVTCVVCKLGDATELLSSDAVEWVRELGRRTVEREKTKRATKGRDSTDDEKRRAWLATVSENARRATHSSLSVPRDCSRWMMIGDLPIECNPEFSYASVSEQQPPQPPEAPTPVSLQTSSLAVSSSPSSAPEVAAAAASPVIGSGSKSVATRVDDDRKTATIASADSAHSGVTTMCVFDSPRLVGARDVYDGGVHPLVKVGDLREPQGIWWSEMLDEGLARHPLLLLRTRRNAARLLTGACAKLAEQLGALDRDCLAYIEKLDDLTIRRRVAAAVAAVHRGDDSSSSSSSARYRLTQLSTRPGRDVTNLSSSSSSSSSSLLPLIAPPPSSSSSDSITLTNLSTPRPPPSSPLASLSATLAAPTATDLSGALLSSPPPPVPLTREATLVVPEPFPGRGVVTAMRVCDDRYSARLDRACVQLDVPDFDGRDAVHAYFAAPHQGWRVHVCAWMSYMQRAAFSGDLHRVPESPYSVAAFRELCRSLERLCALALDRAAAERMWSAPETYDALFGAFDAQIRPPRDDVAGGDRSFESWQGAALGVMAYCIDTEPRSDATSVSEKIGAPSTEEKTERKTGAPSAVAAATPSSSPPPPRPSPVTKVVVARTRHIEVELYKKREARWGASLAAVRPRTHRVLRAASPYRDSFADETRDSRQQAVLLGNTRESCSYREYSRRKRTDADGDGAEKEPMSRYDEVPTEVTEYGSGLDHGDLLLMSTRPIADYGRGLSDAADVRVAPEAPDVRALYRHWRELDNARPYANRVGVGLASIAAPPPPLSALSSEDGDDEFGVTSDRTCTLDWSCRLSASQIDDARLLAVLRRQCRAFDVDATLARYVTRVWHEAGIERAKLRVELADKRAALEKFSTYIAAARADRVTLDDSDAPLLLALRPPSVLALEPLK